MEYKNIRILEYKTEARGKHTHQSVRKLSLLLRIVLYSYILIFLYSFVPLVHAQQVNVSISPPHIELIMKPGASLIQAISLQNSGDPLVFSTSVVSFEPSDDQGGRVFKDKAEGPLRFSLENANIQLGDKFVVQSNKSFQALLKIRAIENAPEGDYYYTFFFVSDPPVTQQSAGRSRSHIGMNILVSITNTGMMSLEGRIAQFQILPRYQFTLFGRTYHIVESMDEVPVIVRVANTGQFMMTPKVKIRAIGAFGQVKSKDLFPVNVLKNSTRLLLQENVPECTRCKTPVSAVFKGWFFGRYTLSADMTFENANKKVFASTEFWAFPIRFMGIMIVVSFICLVILIRQMKHKKHGKGGEHHGK